MTAALTCESAGCKAFASVNVRSTVSGAVLAVCRRCMEELCARQSWEVLL